MGQSNQEIIINAPIKSVWDAISDFHNVDWSKNVLTKLDKVGDVSGAEVGAKRILNDAFHETLQSIDAANHTLSYRITDAPPPISPEEVTNFIGTIDLSEVDGGTKVVWSSRWEGNDEAAYEFCHGIYLALLADMKASLG